MTSKFDKQDKAILRGCLYITIGLCSLLLTYRTALAIDLDICKTRLAKDLKRSSTDGIYNALHDKIESVTNPGMNSAEVQRVLEMLYPVIKLDEQIKLEEKKAVHIAFDTCWFKRNDWKFLFIYSKEDKLEEFINYSNDSP
jgi:hypothetical protein